MNRPGTYTYCKLCALGIVEVFLFSKDFKGNDLTMTTNWDSKQYSNSQFFNVLYRHLQANLVLVIFLMFVVGLLWNGAHMKIAGCGPYDAFGAFEKMCQRSFGSSALRKLTRNDQFLPGESWNGRVLKQFDQCGSWVRQSFFGKVPSDSVLHKTWEYE